MIKDEPVDEHVATDVEFHRRIAQAAANPVLVILPDSTGILLSERRRELYPIPGSAERALSFPPPELQRDRDGLAARSPCRHARAPDQIASEFPGLQPKSRARDSG